MKLFLPQAVLEDWAVSEKADLRENALFMNESNETFPLQASVYFHKLVSGNDEHKLMAKVKTEEQLQALGAEHMAETVILGETAYEVMPGYVVEANLPPSVMSGAEGRKPAAETDLLAAFILNKLS